MKVNVDKIRNLSASLENNKSVNSDDVKKHPSFLQNLKFYISEYCDKTSIHGLKFLAEGERNVFEKIWWLLFLGISIYLSIYFILDAYHKWDKAPVIVSFATSETSISEIPFPSITICPQHKISNELFNITEAIYVYDSQGEENINRTLERMIAYTLLVCYNTKISGNYYGHDYFAGRLDHAINYSKVPEFLLSVQHPISDSIESFRWLAEDFTLDDSKFSPFITSEGLCSSFNMLDPEDLFTESVYKSYYKKTSVEHQPQSNWTLESLFNSEAPVENFPLRTTMTGSVGGFYIDLKINVDDINYVCGDTIQGFKIALHHPGQIPNLNRDYFRVGLNQDVSVAVKPRAVKTSDALIHYKPEKRKCYFAKEKTLKYFQIYDQQNCLMECLANYTLAYCGCVGYFMPRTKSTKVCPLESVYCMEQANAYFLTKEGKEKLPKGKRNYDCSCLPSCTSLDFETEITQSDWNWEAAQAAADPAYASDSENTKSFRSRFYVFFKDMQFITLERNELIGQTDFLASCGGLIGLLTGFSLISFIEMLYYLTLRIISNLFKFGRYYWSGAKELIRD